MITAMPRIAIAARDFAGIVAAFRDVLGMPVVDLSAYSAPNLGAKLAMCVPPGGSNIELMSPHDPAAPLSESLTRFLARRGDGLFALMLEAPDPNAEAELLRARGLGVLPLMAGAGGRDVHPRSTHGVLIRVYPTASFQAQPEQITRNEARALGLSGIARVVIAVSDAKRARDTYERALGLRVLDAGIAAERGVERVLVRAPSGGVIELAQPLDVSRPFAAALAQRLSTSGEGMAALVLCARDPEAVGAALLARGLIVDTRQAGAIEVDARSLFGTRVIVERAASA
ncbi:MAG: VOC family protein [Deltaproteobacteria bacterium]|nr:VOC family protein [Deltaproteobacteria bacterium]